MKKHLTLLLLLLCTMAFGQKRKLVYSYENTATLLQFLDENKVSYDLKDLATLNQLAYWVEYYNAEKLTVPSVYLFDSEGKRIIEDFDFAACGQTLNGLDSLEKIKAYKKEPEVTLNTWLSELDFPFTEEKPFTEPYDLYIIIFYGKLIKTKTSNPTAFNWYNSIKANANTAVKIKPILVSIDLMDNWEIPAELKKHLGIE